ncbi:hypothetical protein MCHIJ_23570 [Mycolicibacterium chitae]|uniref:Uncharacterized protein n=1 Tax=Mycolicibacterium chitae TaxID=1792 RepID=A0A3S4SXN0_MYCCI|nr:hypothetical protein [Mycolicibacterium chitae]MCV7107674.1 hypothetical protein [Mycolicibacterium chitae]BBZ02920.1 hypothetical protein MCHIJ_23570 [Mycolicibacterium chitae]VEG45950.1 Uncharacterised protein [Mycolicibacterium chitae]
MGAKPILTTGVALAAATAIIAATPAILPKETEKTYVTTTSAPLDPSLRQLSVADYRLMAVTFPGLLQAFFNGYGKEVTEDTLVLGPLGALYYLLDQGVLAEVEIDDHFFERGPYAAAGHIARQAGFEEFAEFLEGPWEDLRETFVETVNRLTGGTGDLDDENIELTFAAKLVEGFLFNGGPLGVIRVIVNEIKQAFDPDEPEAVVLNESAIQPQALLVEPELPEPEGPASVRFDPDPEPAEKVEAIEPGPSDANPSAAVKTPSFLPEKEEVQEPADQTAAIQNFQPSTAPQTEVEQPEAAAVEEPGEVSKTKAELRREVFAERLQERREAAKERREALQERVNDVRDKVKDVVERVTGAKNDDQGDDDDEDDSSKDAGNNDNNKAGNDPGSEG